ncbi:carbon-nitrogen hydrolase family protein [Flintibacter sp. KGMB00164]|uniref:carbon-nitrogen hydrolase family protein n=1 Tax=Flintibacter sp. KGMB00164 TaxID=2610895 RepID=UPI0012476B10|nr:carbon-nitrogen hydrolase family protein [Flintibacter sp. KGMB00164]
MNKFIAAAIQMDSTGNLQENLAAITDFVDEAAARGAKLIAMPENVNYVGTESAANAEEVPGGPTFRHLSALAQKHQVWLHCGSIYEKNPDDPRPYNCNMVINPKGELVAKYHKLHPFDVVIKNGPEVKESDRICPGSDIVTVDTGEVGHWGLSICYDIRFGEMYRLMALEGAQILFTPADFTMNTGKDHWEPLLRARAIENGCYVIAPGQYGIKPKFQAYGKSLIVDPWGNVIAKAPDHPCVITAEIDLDYLDKVRKQIFTLENRRSDLYSLTRVQKG